MKASYCDARVRWVVLLCSVFVISSNNACLAESFDGDVTRALFTTSLKINKPQNEALVVENTVRNIYFYSEVEGMRGRTIVHRWEFRGKKLFEKRFRVKSKADILISKMALDPARVGEWMVVITDGKGWPLKAVQFKYVKKGSFAGKGIIPIKQP